MLFFQHAQLHALVVHVLASYTGSLHVLVVHALVVLCALSTTCNLNATLLSRG